MARKLSVVLLAVCLVTAFAVNAADTVYSVNSVGFGKSLLAPDDFLIVSPGFEGMQSDDIQDVLAGQLTGGTDVGNGDNCFLWDSSSQTYIIMFKAQDGTPVPGPLQGKWVIPQEVGLPLVATQDVAVGDAMWVINVQAVTQEVCLRGDVPIAATGSVEIVEGFNFISYPYSADIGIQATDLPTSGAKGGTDVNNSDTIFAWDQDNQVYILMFLAQNSGPVPGPLQGKWVIPQETGLPLVASNSLELTRGVFYVRLAGEGPMTWNEEKPYNL